MAEMKTLTVNGTVFYPRDTSAAPGGFGLGKISYGQSGTFVTDKEKMDGLSANGFWAYYNADVPLSDSDSYTKYVYGITYAYGANFITQVGYCVDTETKIVRHKINGTWGLWLFENPMMSAGVEYPTTEQNSGGLTVYRKRISYILPAALGTEGTYTELLIPHGVENLHACMRASGKVGLEILLPYISASGNVTSVSRVDGENIVIRTKSGWAANSAIYVDLAYTKSS